MTPEARHKLRNQITIDAWTTALTYPKAERFAVYEREIKRLTKELDNALR